MEKIFTRNLGAFMETSEESNDSDNCDSEDYVPETKCSKIGKRFQSSQNGDGAINTNRKIKSSNNNNASSQIKRMPTRRPDPRVSNRNALLARENRRRKKELVVQMETEFIGVKDENKNLKKFIKKQSRIIQKLNLEKSYLRSVLANRSEIMEILKTIRNSKTPISTSSVFKQQPLNNLYSNITNPVPSSPEGSSSDTEDLNYFDNSSSGIASVEDLNGWENLLQYDDNDSFSVKKDFSDIKSEHNYTHTEVTDTCYGEEQKYPSPGVCLHVSAGKVSLEFCSSCHINAQSAFLNED